MIYLVISVEYGPGVDFASNRNQYQEYFLVVKGGRCVGMTTLAPSCADCLELREASDSWITQSLSSPVQGLLLPHVVHTWNVINYVYIHIHICIYK